jgi:hypothetical protein
MSLYVCVFLTSGHFFLTVTSPAKKKVLITVLIHKDANGCSHLYDRTVMTGNIPHSTISKRIKSSPCRSLSRFMLKL